MLIHEIKILVLSSCLNNYLGRLDMSEQLEWKNYLL